MSNESQDRVQEQAREAIRGSQGQHRGRQFALWMGALIIGAILGWLGIPALNQLFDFIATVFTRLFQFIAVPTIALAVITTLSALGAKKETGRIFAHAVTYTLLTTICAAAIGLVLYLWIAPGNLPVDLINSGVSNVPQKLEKSPITTTSCRSSRITCSSRSCRATSSRSCSSLLLSAWLWPSCLRQKTAPSS